MNGTNRLPGAHHWRGVIAAKRKPVVQVSLDPSRGMHVEETGNPSAPVCPENSIRIDLVTESLSVCEDDCAAMLLPGAGHMAFQVEDST